MKSTTRFHNIRRRHARVRNKISGTAERPRLAVKRSLKHMYAQLIDDTTGKSLLQLTTTRKEFDGGKDRSNKSAAKALGGELAKAAQDKGIKQVVFDRGGFVYHGVIKEFAEAAREGGLEF
jgi:large subunit ribosomal protein L18